MFLFTIKDKSVRLLVRTRACTHLSITVVKLIFIYLLRMVLRSFIRHNTVMANLLHTGCLNGSPKLTYVFQSANTAF